MKLVPLSEHLLALVKDYVEGSLSRTTWNAWWAEHSSEVEAERDRFAFFVLKHRGFAGAMSVLGRCGVSF